MNDVIRVYYTLRKVEGKSVHILDKGEWHRLLRSDGTVTELEDLPPHMNSPELKACTITTLASGICNPDPGIDVLRYDEDDAPRVINIDHYIVIENFDRHPEYEHVLSLAGIDDDKDIRDELNSKVFVIKQPPGANHQVEDFPDFVEKARFKGDN